MELLLPDAGLLFWMLLAFGVVFVVLGKYGFPVITKMVEQRRLYIEKSLKEAGEANAALADIKLNSEQILAEAGKQRIKLLQDADETAKAIINEAKTKAAEEGQKILLETRTRIREEKEEALRAVRNEIALISIEIAERVTRSALSRDDEQMKLIQRFI